MNAEERNRFISDLYDEYYDLLKRYCFSRMSDDPILREQAIDCVQTTFEIAIKNCEKLLASKNMGGWLMQTCQYVVLAAKKKHIKHCKGKNGFARYDKRNAIPHAETIACRTK